LLKDSSSRASNINPAVKMDLIRKLNDESYLLGGDFNEKIEK